MKFTPAIQAKQEDFPHDPALVANATRRYLQEKHSILFAVPQIVMDMSGSGKLGATDFRDVITALCVACHSDINGKACWPKWLRLMLLSNCSFQTLNSSLRRLEGRGFMRAYDDRRQVYQFEPSALHLPAWFFAGGLFSALSLPAQKTLIDLLMKSGPAWFGLAKYGRSVEGQRKAFKKAARGHFRRIELEAMRYVPAGELKGRSRQREAMAELESMGIMIHPGQIFSEPQRAGMMLCLNPIILAEPFRVFLAGEWERRQAYFAEVRRKNSEAKRLCRLPHVMGL